MIRLWMDVVRSGWSFFFRMPNVHTERFVPAGIFLGPVLQAFVFGVAWFLVSAAALPFFAQTPVDVSGSEHGAQMTGFFAFLALSLLTGFFHEDGFADTADGLGVPSYGARPDRQVKIREAMKDSRLGTYGVSALVILWICRYMMCQMPGSAALGYLLLAVFSSRLAGLTGACFFIPVSKIGAGRSPGMAGHVLAEISVARRWAWVSTLWVGSVAATVLFCGRLGLGAIVLAGLILSSGAATLCLWLLHKRNGAICGDSIGFSICTTEFILLTYFHFLT